MDWLNYHHLLYFHAAAKEGGISAAAKTLRLAQPTVSRQIRQLEDALGARLFKRGAHGVELTETGRLVYGYAEEIFGLGRELMDAARGKPTERQTRLIVGIVDVLPKLLVHRFLEPALEGDLYLVCRQDRYDRLLAELSTHAVDLVVADSPISPTVSVKAFNHLLGESEVTAFAESRSARRLRKSFPDSIDGFPFLMPGNHTVLRRSLEHWFERRDLRPRVVGEFDDSALLKTFGQVGLGAFAAPSVVEKEVSRQYGVEPIGRFEGIRERFYAITVERRIKHPGVLAISEAAQGLLLH